jgi:hypothetical protein
MNDIRKMEKVFQDAKDLNLCNLVAYGNDGKLYADADHADQLTADVAKEAFEKNLLIVKVGDDTVLKPVAFIDGDVVCITLGDLDAVTAAKFATLEA